MRPAILNPLFAPATVLPGVGARTAAAYERLAGAAGGAPALAPAVGG